MLVSRFGMLDTHFYLAINKIADSLNCSKFSYSNFKHVLNLTLSEYKNSKTDCVLYLYYLSTILVDQIEQSVCCL